MPWLRRLVSAVALVGLTVTLPGWAAAQDEGADPAALLIDSVGAGWERDGADTGSAASLTRNFVGPGARLALQVVPVEPGVDVARLFTAFARPFQGLEPVVEPSLPLATWMVGPGEQPGDRLGGLLLFASDAGIFSAFLQLDETSDIDPVAFLVSVAERQIARSGEPASSPTAASADEEATAELTRLLSDDGHGLQLAGTFELGTDIPDSVRTGTDVERFLDEGTATLVRMWTTSDGSVVAAVSITEYPLELFAAGSLATMGSTGTTRLVDEPSIRAVPGAVSFVGTGTGGEQIGGAVRRGPYVVTVLADRRSDVGREAVVSLVAALTADAAAALPAGASSPYVFPGARSKVAGIAMSIGLVSLAAGGALGVGRVRARRVRDRLGTSGRRSASVLPPPGVLALDADAARLRRRARLVLGGQLFTVNVGVGALSGDFGWAGAYVAALSLVAGLLFTAWWSRHERSMLGPVAPRTERIMLRPGGAVLGVLAFAVLGFGAAFGLKGLRYLVLAPTLAQLKWADLFGLTPRAVGVLFAVGGLGSFVVGAALFRLARAWSRADTRRLLAADPRAPMLYLRSFEDDSVVLAAIVSARRPLLELFSLRGADPFEESIATELDGYGPVIAVGRPGRSLASLGAAREHLPDATWQEQVSARMDAARTIVVAVGETDGLHWEIDRIVSGGHLAKSVFVFPPLPAETLDRRWAFAVAALRSAGAEVGELPVAVDGVHTVQIRPDGSLRVTTAARRDEASYRTAVDRVMEPDRVPVGGSAEHELGDGAHRVG